MSLIQQKIALAKSSTATAEQLTKLANDKNSYVRYWVAQHPNCPISILEKLANDENSDVRYFVAKHPNCPIPILEKLANDEDSCVRYWVAEHPNCPISILEKLANDEDSYVRSIANKKLNVKTKFKPDNNPTGTSNSNHQRNLLEYTSQLNRLWN
jgi:3-methyladenine DNA glycosylase AlkC